MQSKDSGEFYSVVALLALYEFEPELRDVYVEGRIDASFLTWYLDERDLDARVYAIDDRVQVDGSDLREIGLDVGARGRVMGLAVLAERVLGSAQHGITCLIDADYAYATGPIPRENSCLLLTDAASLDCYVLQPRPLNKLLRLGLHLPASISAEDVLAALRPALLDLFCARAVLFAFDIACIEGFVRLCSLRVGGSSADIRGLIQRSMGRLSRREFPLGIDDLVGWAQDLRRAVDVQAQFGKGHDIAPLLISYLGLKGALAHPDALEAAMRASLEVVDLQDKALFVRLEARIA